MIQQTALKSDICKIKKAMGDLAYFLFKETVS